MPTIENKINVTSLLHSDPVASLVILGEESQERGDTTAAAIIKSAVSYAFAEAGLEAPEQFSQQKNEKNIGHVIVCKSPYGL